MLPIRYGGRGTNSDDESEDLVSNAIKRGYSSKSVASHTELY